VTCTDILITEREGAEGGPTPIPTARGDPLCTCPIGEFTNKEGSYKPQVTTCFPCRSGCRPATLSLVLGWPGVLLVICLSLRIHRATAAVAKLPKPPQQRRQPGNHSKRISDKKLQLKTRLTWFKPAPFLLYMHLIGKSSFCASNWTGLEILSDIREMSQWQVVCFGFGREDLAHHRTSILTS
jgi:hypothetical protein